MNASRKVSKKISTTGWAAPVPLFGQDNSTKYDFYPPIVEINVELKASSENLNSTQVFPTPESPIKSSLNK